MKNTIFLFLLLFGLASCDSTYQYDVYVANETDAPIEVSFKSLNEPDSSSEATLTLGTGEMKRIISTGEIDTGGGGMSATHCSQVAEYVRAVRNGQQSTLEWCSDAVQFEKTDIGQGEFTIRYTAGDF